MLAYCLFRLAEFADKIFSYRNKSRDGIEVNLPDQTITKVTGEKNLLIFPDTKANMINGFDDIDYLQNIKKEVIEFADTLPIRKSIKQVLLYS
jgi:3-isopropylmalate/(R)-2-methylmalate dehydratase small subunit